MTNLTLRDLKIGSVGVVTGFQKSDPVYRDKLLSMGLTRGTPFTVVRVAPLGDPVEILVRGFQLSLRRSEAEIVLVQRTDCSRCEGCTDRGCTHV